MNCAYSLVLKKLICAWIARLKDTRHRSKKGATVLTCLFISVTFCVSARAQTPLSNQLPIGGQVSAGKASLQQSTSTGGATLNIQQVTARAVINWQSFNLGSSAQVNFNQPDANSVTLNRVLDSNPSQIFGRISAQGQVFISNPQGVVFGSGSSVPSLYSLLTSFSQLSSRSTTPL